MCDMDWMDSLSGICSVMCYMPSPARDGWGKQRVPEGSAVTLSHKILAPSSFSFDPWTANEFASASVISNIEDLYGDSAEVHSWRLALATTATNSVAKRPCNIALKVIGIQ